MTKTNFTKVEEALNEGLLRMNISGLLDMASTASKMGSPSTAKKSNSFARRELLAALQFEIKHCKNEDLFTEGGISRRELKELLKQPSELKPEEWDKLRLFRQKAYAYKKKIIETQPDENDKLVEAQRKRHINKRYNTKEEWLPLH